MTPASAEAHRTARVLEADVVIVGARCAGAATAMLLARAGHDVLVLDRADFPSDTISTHVIARSGMVQLHRWGVLDAVVATGAPPVRRVEFTSDLGFMQREVKDRHGVDFLLAPRRIVLDAVLQQAAREAGARIRTGVAVTDVVRDAVGRVAGVVGHDDEGAIEVRARHVVGADGLSSRIARSVSAPLTIVRPALGAAQYAYFVGDWPAIEHHLGPDAFAGVFPTHDGQACIWICLPEKVARASRRQHRNPDDAFMHLMSRAVPGLGARLDAAARTTPVRGMLRMPNHARQAVGPGWALVGDAGFHRDAITGHGISDAFRDAELLAVALDEALRDPAHEAAALAAYERDRDRLATEIFEITCALSRFPEQAHFLQLQKQLAVAIDVLAAELAARPLPRATQVAA
ncbi:MAG TPA: NAD(P)/FAD-dependent oxidoreductase [Humibacillus sp.]|nr:NAD(P)/FAD-dependent oxidoreductase [Humibacillus sp.]